MKGSSLLIKEKREKKTINKTNKEEKEVKSYAGGSDGSLTRAACVSIAYREVVFVKDKGLSTAWCWKKLKKKKKKRKEEKKEVS